MPDYKVYAPLHGFIWGGDRFSVTRDLEIIRVGPRPDLRGLDDGLGDDVLGDISMASHWLAADWSSGSVPKASEMVNLFLLSTWLARPTRTRAKIRFEVATDLQAVPGRYVQLLDRFNWVPGNTSSRISDADLAETKTLYAELQAILRSPARLLSALILTMAGCMAHRWETAMVCHAAASEAMLSYSTGHGVTRRLAVSYACLAGETPGERDAAFTEFYEVYNLRSDVMHGRGYKVPAEARVPTVGRIENIVRRLWKAILRDPHLVGALEGTDEQRKALFQRLQGSYTPST